MAEIEERQAKIEGILEQIDKRLTRVETEIRGLHSKIDSEIRGLHSKIDSEIKGLRTEINGLRTELVSKIDSNFKWQIGIMLTMWVTIIIAVLKKG